MNIEKNISLKLKMSTDESIRKKSCGEISSTEIFTKDFSDYHPEGIFSQKIFGPSVDYKCACGNKKGKNRKGELCEFCEVLIESSEIRKERFGHIELSFPVKHPLYNFKNRIILNTIPVVPPNLRPMYLSKEIKSFLTNNNYLQNKPELLSEESDVKKQESDLITAEKNNIINIDRNNINIDYGNLNDLYIDIISYNKYLLTLVKYNEIQEFYKAFDFFCTDNNLKELNNILKDKSTSREEKNNTIAVKYKNILQGIIELNPKKTNTDEVLEKVRLLRYIFHKARENKISDRKIFKSYIEKTISKGKSKILQEKVNNLFTETRTNKSGSEKPIRSLNRIMSGKGGRIRNNLLGKRVDFSGRATIVVNPLLKINQCGLPYKIAIKLFQPYLIRNFIQKKGINLLEYSLNNSKIKDIITYNIKDSLLIPKKLDSQTLEILKYIENTDEKIVDEIMSELEKIMSDKFMILNRAPTLHRLNVQSFKPILTKGDAIEMHPLVLKSFNADIDGDQMAVHLPLSFESLKEAEELLISGKYILSPRDGKPIINLSQDLILGCYYMTMIKKNSKEKGKIFSNFNEATIAFNNNIISVHTNISIRMKNEIIRDTCYGRALFNSLLPNDYNYINDNIDYKKMNNIILSLTLMYREQIVIEFLEKLKIISLEYATTSGITMNLERPEGIKKEYIELKKVYESYEDNIIKSGIDCSDLDNIESISKKRNDTIKELEVIMKKELESSDGFNPINIIIKSGARGSYSNFFQILVSKGIIIKGVENNKNDKLLPFILNSYYDGLKPEEYLNTTSSSRLVLYNEKKLLPESGHLFRILGLALRDIVITTYDCGTNIGLSKKIYNASEKKDINYYSFYGSLSLNDIYDIKTNKLIVRKNQVIDNIILDDLILSGINKIDIRSPLYCTASKGICRMCYGNDIASNKLIALGESIGIIAAQSISEPTSQMILKSFHTGGVNKKEDISTGIKSIQGILLAESENIKKYFTNIKRDFLISDNSKKEQIIKELLFNELVNIYSENKININDKHLEIACSQLKFEGKFEIVDKHIKSGPKYEIILEKIESALLNKSLEETYNLINKTNKKFEGKCIILRSQNSKYKKYSVVKKKEIERLNSKLLSEGKPKIQFSEIKKICLVPKIKGLRDIISESDGIFSRIGFQEVIKNIKECLEKNIIEKYDSFTSQTMIGKKLEIGKNYFPKERKDNQLIDIIPKE